MYEDRNCNKNCGSVMGMSTGTGPVKPDEIGEIRDGIAQTEILGDVLRGLLKELEDKLDPILSAEEPSQEKSGGLITRTQLGARIEMFNGSLSDRIGHLRYIIRRISL